MAAAPNAGRAPSFTAADFDPARTLRFCDVIMKGGVTSGIVYPLAVCHLATRYILKSIGGTSVGAIAAAIAAAAEFRRRTNLNGPPAAAGAGYEAFSKLPNFLARKGVLLRLFAADGMARPLLRIALCLVGSGSASTKFFKAVGALSLNFWFVALPAAVLVFWLVNHGDPIDPKSVPLYAKVVVAALVALVFALAAAVLWCIRTLSSNAFGWCHAYDEKKAARLARKLRDGLCITDLRAADTPPLFAWLHEFIEYTAGPGRAKPLTFGDLRGAPMPSWDTTSNSNDSIDFRMVTTCVTLGRPLEMPFDAALETIPPLYFTAEDVERYFPSAIVTHLKGVAAASKIVGGTTYYELPEFDDVPIVFAARLSMSFPVLFCAMRLFADAPQTPRKPASMRPVWFTDGGLSSNFPIHFFDSPMPRWPTFAIDLLGSGTPVDAGGTVHADDVFLEDTVPVADLTAWDAIPASGFFGPLSGFVSGLVDAMRTWQDSTLATLRGNRSRTVGIRLPNAEGGINLTMTPDQVEDLIRRGDVAGKKVLHRFANGDVDPIGWQDHRWIRYRATMGALSRWLEGFTRSNSALPNQDGQAKYSEMIRSFVAATPTAELHPDIADLLLPDSGTAEHCSTTTQELSDFFGAVLAHKEAAAAFTHGEALPSPDLVARPPL